MKNNTNEDTLYDRNVRKEEKNCLESNVATGKEQAEAKNTNVKKSGLGRVASGLGMGILLGGTASYVSAKSFDGDGKEDIDNDVSEDNDNNVNNNVGDNTDNQSGDDIHQDTWSDGALPVAESVTDDMNFSEAFGAARAEVGAGGVFEWRGNVYNTYYAEEWNAMSEYDKSEFVSHLSLTDIDDNDTSGPETETEELVEVIAIEDDIAGMDTDVEVVPLDEPASDIDDDVVSTESEEEYDIEIMGVYHDEDVDMNIGSVVVDGQEIVFLDADNDNDKFEYVAIDINNDGYIDADEIADISDYDLPVDSLRVDSFDNSYLAYDDTLDYISDADVSDMM